MNSPVALNGKPTVKPIVSQYFTGVYNPHPVALYYIPGAGTTAPLGRWAIYNDDGVTMPSGASFNVLIPAAGVKVDATPLISIYNLTAIPTEKGNATAFLYFTHMWNPYMKSTSLQRCLLFASGHELPRQLHQDGDWTL